MEGKKRQKGKIQQRLQRLRWLRLDQNHNNQKKRQLRQTCTNTRSTAGGEIGFQHKCTAKHTLAIAHQHTGANTTAQHDTNTPEAKHSASCFALPICFSGWNLLFAFGFFSLPLWLLGLCVCVSVGLRVCEWVPSQCLPVVVPSCFHQLWHSFG